MTTATDNAKYNPVSPVNVEERKNFGIQSGDTVRVHQKVQEASGKTRIQIFEGIVLAVKHGTEAGATFTVRRSIDGVGVEKIYPLYSPMIDKIEIVRRAKVRRAKLCYIRDKAVRQIKRQMRRMTQMNQSTEGESERALRETQEAAAEAGQAEETQAKAEAAKIEDDVKSETETATPEVTETSTPDTAGQATAEAGQAEETVEETKEDTTEEPVVEEALEEEVKSEESTEE